MLATKRATVTATKGFVTVVPMPPPSSRCGARIGVVTWTYSPKVSLTTSAKSDSSSSSSSSSCATQRRIALSLYRALLRATVPFTPPSRHAVAFNCLLDRSGDGDENIEWNAYESIFENPSDRSDPYLRFLRTGSLSIDNNDEDCNDNDVDDLEDLQPPKPPSSTAPPTTTTEENDINTCQDEKQDKEDEKTSKEPEETKNVKDRQEQQQGKLSAAPKDYGNDDGNDENAQKDNDDDIDDEEAEDLLGIDLTHLLFRKLLREVISGSPMGVRQMQFPQHFQKDQDPYRLRRIIQREFRCRRRRGETKNDKNNKHLNNTDGTTNEMGNRRHGREEDTTTGMSASFSDSIRTRVAFLALRRINEKLSWHEELQQKAKASKQRSCYRSAPASDIVTTKTAKEVQGGGEGEEHQEVKVTNTTTSQQDQWTIGTGAAWNVSPLALQPSSSYLQPGTFLIAHPNLSGYFRRAVICILDDHHYRHVLQRQSHSANPPIRQQQKRQSRLRGQKRSEAKEDATKDDKIKDDTEDDDKNDEDNKEKDDDNEEDWYSPTSFVGTYGLVVNRITCYPATGHPVTLGESFAKLPTEFQSAFGDCWVREGGPVQGSVQMMHSISSKLEQDLKLSGHVLRMAESGSSSSQSSTSDRPKRSSGTSTSTTTTATTTKAALPDDDDDDDNNKKNNRENVLGQDDEKADVKFRGDIMNAAASVLSGRLSKQQLSFFGGCSSWSPGQLENEIERGTWLPCRGPPEIAFSGRTIHNPPASLDDGDSDAQLMIRNQILGNSRSDEHPNNDDLWLSMLSACGEEAAELAHLLSHDDGEHPFGGSCDAFDSQ